VEREIKALSLDAQLDHRRQRSAPIADALPGWLTAQRAKVAGGNDTGKVIDCSLNRWAALTRYLDDARLPIDNNHDEQQIRLCATRRKNWLFAGELAAGQRAAAITSLIQSATLNASARAKHADPTSSASRSAWRSRTSTA
jgi:transposase